MRGLHWQKSVSELNGSSFMLVPSEAAEGKGVHLSKSSKFSSSSQNQRKIFGN